MDIIGKKYIFLSLSGVLVLVSALLLVFWGLKPGIDFTGGSLLELEFLGARPSVVFLQGALAKVSAEAPLVQPAGEHGYLFRFQSVDEETHQKIVQAVKEASAGAGGNPDGVREKRFDSIGPTIGAELKRRALLAVALAILGIVSYVAWAFRKVSKPVASWKYGAATIVALVHDVVIPAGVFSALGHFKGIEVDALFITALLTILGFSVHDTIVVFDRIRENLQKLKGVESYALTVNRSILETVARSINTSLTVLLVLLSVFFLGGETTRFFALALAVGVTFGTYSSIFVASPLLVIWERYQRRRK